jgi:hypothetical protein
LGIPPLKLKSRTLTLATATSPMPGGAQLGDITALKRLVAINPRDRAGRHAADEVAGVPIEWDARRRSGSLPVVAAAATGAKKNAAVR